MLIVAAKALRTQHARNMLQDEDNDKNGDATSVSVSQV
jgi:hypothetical protein